MEKIGYNEVNKIKNDILRIQIIIITWFIEDISGSLAFGTGGEILAGNLLRLALGSS